MLKFRRSGKSVNLKSDDPDNPILEVAKSQADVNINNENDVNLEEIYSQKNGTLDSRNEQKFQPMAIGSARSSSRNSFVLK